MTDSTDLRFFEALKTACHKSDRMDQAVLEAIEQAVETGGPRDLMAARQAFDGLDEPLKSALLRQVHMQMATDPSAIWDALPGAPRKQPLN